MRNVIRMVGVGIAALCMVTSTVQGQVKLNASNIDEVIGQDDFGRKSTHGNWLWYVDGR